MYRNVDAEMQLMKLFTKYVTKEMQNPLTQIKVDPCMFYLHDNNEKVELMVIIYIDDMILCGEPSKIKYSKMNSKVFSSYPISEIFENIWEYGTNGDVIMMENV